MRLFTLALLLVASFTNAADLPSTTPEAAGFSRERLQRVERMVDKYVSENRVTGMVTLVARHGKLVDSQVKGTMGMDNQAPMQIDSLFRIYSMTKATTAVAALILYEEGYYQLDDPVSKFLPAFAEMTVFENGKLRPATQPITMHQLFTHMSGLSYGDPAGHEPLAHLGDLKISESRKLDEFVQRVSQLPLLYEPGEQWRYSYASDVLGAVVEKLSGQPLGEFFKTHIFDQLDMPDTAFSVPAEKLSRLATQHAWDADNSKMVITAGVPFAPNYRVTGFDSGGGGLISTAGDYLRFLEMLRAGGILDGKRILGPKTIKFMTQDHLPLSITDANIGPDHDRTLGIGGGHGLGIGVYIDPIRRGVLSSRGEIEWGGASGTVYWWDPVEDVVVVGMIQLFRSPWRFRDDLSVAIYQALTTTLE